VESRRISSCSGSRRFSPALEHFLDLLAEMALEDAVRENVPQEEGDCDG